MEPYEQGDVVRYRDGGASGYSVAIGSVNGPSMQHGATTMIPVWTLRNDGREATTIYVDARNIISPPPLKIEDEEPGQAP